MGLKEKIELINNQELNEIINFVKDSPVFFADNTKRLLSMEEILNYKTELNINIDIIPLVDEGDNSFLIFNKKENKFQMCDISSELCYKNIENIKKYLELLEETNGK